jgi:hypothetical protein
MRVASNPVGLEQQKSAIERGEQNISSELFHPWGFFKSKMIL